MRIGICDDEAVQREYLKKMTAEWGRRKKLQLSFQQFENAEEFLFHYEDKRELDVLLLDIQLGGENGMSMAKSLRKKKDDLPIIFVTGIEDYLGQGYEVDALHYLLKPVSAEKLEECLDKVYQKSQKKEAVLMIQGKDVLRRIYQRDILKIEAFSHSCIITTIEGELEVNRGIGSLEKELEPGRFIHSHRSCLVNLSQIESIEKERAVLSGGVTAPVSRRLYTAFNQAFIRYYLS